MSRRAAGILLHPTSLPGPHGSGDFGPAAHAFVRWLADAGITVWQVLPLVPTGLGNSPYGGTSAFAGNPLMISPEMLVSEGLLPPEALADRPRFPRVRIDWGQAISWKETVLRRAHAHFSGLPVATASTTVGDIAVAPNRAETSTRAGSGSEAQCRELADFLADPSRAWLADWTLFAALKQRWGGGHWAEWPAPLRQREPQALAAARVELADEIAYHGFVQWLWHRQWTALRAAAAARSIRVLGDLPIYLADDSADVWAAPELFELDASGRPTVIAGVPPDFFSSSGQRWGNPLYRWSRHRETHFAWWLARLRRNLELADFVRLDHFRGFAAYWELPANAPDGRHGRWVAAPGRELFTAVRETFAGSASGLPLVAEDLGVITPDVVALRRDFGLPGMRVLQFAFGAPESDHLPHQFGADTVVYTATHDNDTTRGWFDKAGIAERRRAQRYLGCGPQEVVDAMLRAAFASVAELAIAPLQDILELGGEGRMNTPSRPEGNWAWRVAPGPRRTACGPGSESGVGALRPEHAARLRRLLEVSGRLATVADEPLPSLPDGYPKE